jgi:hypothetical protein
VHRLYKDSSTVERTVQNNVVQFSEYSYSRSVKLVSERSDIQVSETSATAERSEQVSSE